MAKRKNRKNRRLTKIDKKVIDLWETLGTIEFNSYDDIAMMIDEYNVNAVRLSIKRLLDEGRIFLMFDDCWKLDYIPF